MSSTAPEPPSPGPPSCQAFESRTRSVDGLELFGRHYRTPSPRGRILVLHGYAEHQGRYDELVATLTGQGLDLDLPDLRGHGRSEGPRGYVARFDLYRNDLDRFLAESARNAPHEGTRPLPRLVLGHSLGGLLALSYCLHRPDAFDAVAVTSPFLAPAIELPGYKVLLGKVAARIAPEQNLGGAIDPALLTHDRERADAYRHDPLVFHSFNPRWFLAAREAQQELDERASELTLPSLFLLAGDDRIADTGHSERVFERLGAARRELHVYPGLFHEVLNETDRGRVLADLAAWIDGVLGAPS